MAEALEPYSISEVYPINVYSLVPRLTAAPRDIVPRLDHPDVDNMATRTPGLRAEVDNRRTVRESSLPSTPSSKPGGGYECEFVQPPPAHLQTECPICLLVLRAPQLTSCCGHNLCRGCIERVRTAGKACPLCNAEGFVVTYNRSYDVSLMQFEVNCTHRRFGCEWKGKLEVLDSHLNVDPKSDRQLEGCAFARVRCYNYGCRLIFERRFIVEHQCRECPLRVFSCEHCHEYESTYRDVTTNHWAVCKCYPLPCPHECRQETIQRQNLEQHLNKECPLHEVACEFQGAGCKTRLLRKDMPDHLTETMVYHMTLLARQNQTLAQRNQELMAKLLEKDEQFENMRKDTEEKVQVLHDRIELLATDHRRGLEEAGHKLEEFKQRMDRLENNPAGNSKHERVEIVKKVQHYGSTGERAAISASSVPKYSLLEKRVESQLSQPSPGATATVPETEMVMTHFQQRKRNNDSWSRELYTHPGGYKMCFIVHANGHGNGEGTHVSCYISLVYGEFDDVLKWPFRANVTIQLVNQRGDRGHHSRILSYDYEESNKYNKRRLTRGHKGTSLGKPRFIPHHDLDYNPADHCQYLKNDTLVFRVLVELLY